MSKGHLIGIIYVMAVLLGTSIGINIFLLGVR